MENELFTLYKNTLPEIIRNEETVKRILRHKSNHIIIRRAGNRVVSRIFRKIGLQPYELSRI